MMRHDLEVGSPDAAYPLQRRFYKFVFPWLVLSAVTLVAATVWGGRHLLVNAYLEQAARDAKTLVGTLVREDDATAAAWFARFGSVGSAASGDVELRRVGALLDGMVSDRALPKLKIYDMQGVIRYSSVHAEIGRIERGPGLDHVLRNLQPTVVKVDMPEGPQFELYVLLPQTAAAPGMVVEMYEPSALLDSMLRNTLMPAVLLPGITLIGISGLLVHLVRRAQKHLEAQKEQVAALQARLEKLVSNRAAMAVKQGLSPLTQGHVVDASLYFSDVRDFSGFAEANRAEAVVQLLNRLISIQVDMIDRHGGDVDKIIGDAVLAVFSGPDRARRAIACAQAVLDTCAGQADLPRGLAIGVHDGVVVAGAIGAPDRQDYTVIGDAVNVSQRLCTLAGRGELVADVPTLQRAGHPEGFGAVEEHLVKGRSASLRTRRWHASPS